MDTVGSGGWLLVVVAGGYVWFVAVMVDGDSGGWWISLEVVVGDSDGWWRWNNCWQCRY